MASFSPGGNWSHSSANLFRSCNRAHFYNVYGTWGGWSKRGTAVSQALYLAKNSKPLLAYAGIIVHDVAKKTLEHVRAGRPLADADILVARVREKMTHGIAYSAAKKWETAPRIKDATCILRDHAEGKDLLDATVESAIERAELTTRRFLDVWLPKMQDYPISDWLMIDSLDMLNYHDFRIFMAPDFLLSDGDTYSTVIDWKTGQYGDVDQLRAYGTYRLAKVLGRMPQRGEVFDHRINGLSVPLLRDDGSWDELEALTVDDVAQVLDRIEGDVAEMKPLMKAGEKLDRHAFPKTEHRGQCDDCPFLFHCDSED